VKRGGRFSAVVFFIIFQVWPAYKTSRKLLFPLPSFSHWLNILKPKIESWTSTSVHAVQLQQPLDLGTAASLLRAQKETCFDFASRITSIHERPYRFGWNAIWVFGIHVLRLQSLPLSEINWSVTGQIKLWKNGHYQFIS